MTRPLVDILLATYNGEKYLTYFLDSLIRQGDVDIRLIVGDDGSEDSTLKILEEYRSFFAGFELHHFQHIGPKENFLRLLEFSNADFVAFADQDDVWMDNRLQSACSKMGYCEDPTLIISPLYDLNKGALIDCELLSFPANLMRNEIHGCAQVFNSSLRNLAKGHDSQAIVMHDWWVVLVAQLFGHVMFDTPSGVGYRIHEDNAIGLPSALDRALFYLSVRRVRTALRHTKLQASLLNDVKGIPKSQEDIVAMSRWLKGVNSHVIRRFFYLLTIIQSRSLRPIDSVKILLGLYR